MTVACYQPCEISLFSFFHLCSGVKKKTTLLRESPLNPVALPATETLYRIRVFCGPIVLSCQTVAGSGKDVVLIDHILTLQRPSLAVPLLVLMNVQRQIRWNE